MLFIVFDQSQSVVKQCQCKREITFDIRLKTAAVYRYCDIGILMKNVRDSQLRVVSMWSPIIDRSLELTSGRSDYKYGDVTRDTFSNRLLDHLKKVNDLIERMETWHVAIERLINRIHCK